MSVGIDIGRYEIKAVQLNKSPKGYQLVAFGSEPVFDQDRDYDPERLDEGKILAAAEKLFAKMKLNPRRVKLLTSGLSNQQSSIRQLKMMNTDDEAELTQSLQFEARKHIPMDGTDALMDYQILGEDVREMDKLNVLLVASTQRNLNNHLKLLRGMNLRPGLVDAEAVGMANSYIIEHGLPEEGTHVFLNMGAVSSVLVVWGRNAPFFARDIQIGGHHITKEIMTKKEMGYQDAENFKKSPAFTDLKDKLQGAGAENFSVSVAEHTIFDNLVDEMRRSLRYYIKESNESFFQKILIVGGSAGIPGLAEFISDRLNIPTDIFDPFAQLHHEHDIDGTVHAAYSTAVGYAMRGLLE